MQSHGTYATWGSCMHIQKTKPFSRIMHKSFQIILEQHGLPTVSIILLEHASFILVIKIFKRMQIITFTYHGFSLDMASTFGKMIYSVPDKSFSRHQEAANSIFNVLGLSVCNFYQQSQDLVSQKHSSISVQKENFNLIFYVFHFMRSGYQLNIL